MLTSGQQERKSKQRKIRNSEYYDMEGTFDRLYAESKKDKTFNHLMEIIESEENIKLAYRTIKKNTGSDTSGVDKRTIADLAKLSEEEYVRLIRKQFSNYHPRPVRRVEIPKPNGKTRPLGIPTIVDRIVQQCILQVMEPICEAKFSENSNGFRPNRSAETAIAQCMRLIQVQHLYHVVDLDIKGFFDNISHTKLIRQIWALGIRDKKLLCIIKEMLKAPVVLPNGEKTYPTRGTPQGGILSPLLANIVLNELDWWIASQWEQMPTKTKFKTRSNAQGTEIKSHAYRALRRSRLKSPEKEDNGIGAMAVYKYSRKNLPYTVIIMIKLSTVTNRLPINVTAHNGILSKNPHASTAVTISCGRVVCCGVPNPPAFIIVLIIPCTILNSAIISSKP